MRYTASHHYQSYFRKDGMSIQMNNTVSILVVTLDFARRSLALDYV